MQISAPRLYEKRSTRLIAELHKHKISCLTKSSMTSFSASGLTKQLTGLTGLEKADKKRLNEELTTQKLWSIAAFNVIIKATEYEK